MPSTTLLYRLSKPRALRLALNSALLLSPLAAAVASAPAWAQSVQAEYSFDIPAGALDDVIAEYSRIAGVSVSFAPDSAAGRHSPGVKGRLNAAAALQQLLHGSGLQSVARSDNSYILQPVVTVGEALELGVTTIEGQGMGEMTENSRSYTTSRVSVGSKTPTSLRETPQSVSVITEQLIKDKQLTGLGDAMKLTPGITVKNANFRLPQFTSRGFTISNLQIDGTAPMDIGSGIGSFYGNKTYDLAEFDHVEVLRGAGGLFSGVGDPGGVVNLVRKRPLEDFQLKVSTSAGSWDNYRSEIDVTGPIAFDGNLRGRMVTAYTNRQYFMDERRTEQPLFYGVLEADLSPFTRITVGGRSDQVHENGIDDGLPRYSDGRDLGLSRNTWFSPSWAYMDVRSQELFAKLDHEFSENLKLNVSYTHTQDASEAVTGFLYGTVNPVTGRGATWWGAYNTTQSRQSLWDANISGNFTAFDRTHEFLLGMDRQAITSRWRGANGVTAGRGDHINVFDPSSTPWLAGTADKNVWRDYNPNTQEQYGLYSTLRLQLSDPLKLIMGARVARYKFEQVYQTRANDVWSVAGSTNHREPTKVVPYGGLVYALDDQWSAYVSYSKVFKPQAQRQQGPLPGSSMEPMTGKTYETGVKGELWGGDLNVSAALFYTDREGEATLDPAYPLTSVFYGGSCCYLAQGQVISKGVDLEASGEVLPGLMLIAGYTYNHNENKTEGGIFSSITPKHQFKLWSTYELPDAFSKWKVGGGVNLQSANYVSGTANIIDSAGSVVRREAYDYRQSGYAVWDAMLEYQVDENWSVTLNGNNLLDRKYYETVGPSDYANYYGAPRNYMLTLRGTFN